MIEDPAAFKAELLAEALREAVAQELPFPETGDFKRDVHLQLANFVKLLTGRRGRMFKAFVAAAQSDPEMADAFLSTWVKPRRAEAKSVLERYQQNGQLPSGIDLEVFLDLLYGPFYLRLLAGHGPLSPAYANSVAELALRGIGNIATNGDIAG